MENLEKEILETAKKGIGEAISSQLQGYNSPLRQMADEAINKHKDEFVNLFDVALDSFLKDKTFQEEIKSVMIKKMTQEMLANTSSEIQAVIAKIQQKNPVLKQEIEVAISKIIKKYNSDN